MFHCKMVDGSLAVRLCVGFPSSGSGKGTISAKILKDFPFTHISTGDLLRDEIHAGSKIGNAAKRY